MADPAQIIEAALPGYQILRPFGPRDRIAARPRLWHALPVHSWTAVCGFQPAAGIEDWSEEAGERVTCPGCRTIVDRWVPHAG